MHQFGDADVVGVFDAHIPIGPGSRHVDLPCLAERLMGCVPRRPLRFVPERARALSEGFLEGAGEGFRPLVSAVERDLQDGLILSERELVRGALETRELHVSVDADPEEGGELPMEMIPRESRDPAQRVDAQILVEMLLDMLEHPLEPGPIMVGGLRRHADLRLDLQTLIRNRPHPA